MKHTLIGIALVAALLIPSGDSWGQNILGGIFWAPNQSRRVTLSQNGATIASLLVPAGAFMSATYDNIQRNLVTPSRWELHGDVTLKFQPAATAPGQPPGRNAAEIMSNPPATMTLSGVDVLIENVTP